MHTFPYLLKTICKGWPCIECIPWHDRGIRVLGYALSLMYKTALWQLYYLVSHLSILVGPTFISLTVFEIVQALNLVQTPTRQVSLIAVYKMLIVHMTNISRSHAVVQGNTSHGCIWWRLVSVHTVDKKRTEKRREENRREKKSLLRRQARARTIGHSPKGKKKSWI